MSSKRRKFLKTLFAGLASLVSVRQLRAQEGNSLNSAERLTTRNVVSLEDQLKNGLRVSRPKQQAFIKVVVHHVDHGKLPRAMVTLVYDWAIKRNPAVPFPYFQYALRALSRRRGINLP